MSDEYIMTTKDISNKNFNIGSIVYAKKDKTTNKTDFYEKNDIVGEEKIGVYINTVRNKEKKFVDKFDMPFDKRKAYMVTDINGFEYTLNYLYQEDDIFEDDKVYIYKNLIYKIDNNRIIISGFTGNNPNIQIPESIDGREVYAIGNIDDNGLYYPLNINSDMFYNIKLPDTIKEIFPNAFMNKSIKQINFPSNLYYIGQKAFYGSRIERADLIKTQIDSIEEECFESSTIKEVIFPSTLSYIRNSAFKYSDIEKVIFNSNILLIEEDAFLDCNIDTNRTKVWKVEKNGFTCETPSIEKECEYISYDDISYQILGRLKLEDYQKDKILHKQGIEENCKCLKQVFFAKNEESNYEILIEFDEEFGDDDLFLEYLKYKNSVRISLYKVKEFDKDRFFEEAVPEFDDIKISGRVEDGQISVKYDDIGKIEGIKLSERYRYNYENWVYNEYNSGEFTRTNTFLTLNKIFGLDESEFIFNSEEQKDEYNLAKEDYENFKK